MNVRQIAIEEAANLLEGGNIKSTVECGGLKVTSVIFDGVQKIVVQGSGEEFVLVTE